MEKDPRNLGYLYPSIPPSVVLRRTCDWYGELVRASIVDTLRASRRVAVHRALLTQKRREELADRVIRIGRKTYFVMELADIPRRARRIYRNGWPIIDEEGDTYDYSAVR